MAILTESPEVIMSKIQSSKSHYETLFVTQASKLEDITKHYRKLCLIFHPDKNKSHGAEEVFKKIASAYETLKEPDSRRTYDQQLQIMLYRATVPVRTSYNNRPVQPRPPAAARSAQAGPPPRPSQTVWKDGKLYELPRMIKCPTCQCVFEPTLFHVTCQKCKTYLFAGVEVVQPPVHPHQRAGFHPPGFNPSFDTFFARTPNAPNHPQPPPYAPPPRPSGPYMPHQSAPPPQQPQRPDFQGMSVKEIKSFLEQEQVDISDCVERTDLVRKAEKAWSAKQPESSSTGANQTPSNGQYASTHPHHQHPSQFRPSSSQVPNFFPSQYPHQSNGPHTPQQAAKGSEKENIPSGTSSKSKQSKKSSRRKRKAVVESDEELDSDVEDPDERGKKRHGGASALPKESMDGINLSNIVPEGTRRSARAAATKKVSYVAPSEDDIEADADTSEQRKKQEALQEIERRRKAKAAEEASKKQDAVPPSSTPSSFESPAGKPKPPAKGGKKDESSSENEQDKLFEVEAIVGKQVEARGKRTTIRYHVKWKDSEELTWETRSSLLRTVKEMIEEFEENAAKANEDQNSHPTATEGTDNKKNSDPNQGLEQTKAQEVKQPPLSQDPKQDSEPKKAPETKKRPLVEDPKQPEAKKAQEAKKQPLSQDIKQDSVPKKAQEAMSQSAPEADDKHDSVPIRGKQKNVVEVD